MITENDLKKLRESRKSLELIRLRLGYGSLAASARLHLNDIDRGLKNVERLLMAIVTPAESPR